jgi:hypothetical protein
MSKLSFSYSNLKFHGQINALFGGSCSSEFLYLKKRKLRVSHNSEVNCIVLSLFSLEKVVVGIGIPAQSGGAGLILTRVT